MNWCIVSNTDSLYWQWSFGITCWEVFSGGKVPYGGIKPLSILGMLEAGHRMNKPANAACSKEMYAHEKIVLITNNTASFILFQFLCHVKLLGGNA